MMTLKHYAERVRNALLLVGQIEALPEGAALIIKQGKLTVIQDGHGKPVMMLDIMAGSVR